ncbi:hypothetical protein LT85_3576 [Collimonas arenae]|uniref:Uncharacterized protein n=1 Tax=Collimonas arenae TaxID=279058 RepID=A0A0A1FGM5_9BURK|nr:hypothetical protein LT85_3576 [Collimonas arenae]
MVAATVVLESFIAPNCVSTSIVQKMIAIRGVCRQFVALTCPGIFGPIH